MAEVMTVTEFMEVCGSAANGYVLRPGQKHPETHQDLVDIMGDRLWLKESNTSIDGLKRWVEAGSTKPDSCSPDVDTEHVKTVLLMAELPDPDAYVASLPRLHKSIMFPPLDLLQLYVADQQQPAL